MRPAAIGSVSLFFPAVLTLFSVGTASVAMAKVRIYGGPVPSAGSGKYYAPHGGVFPAYIDHSTGYRGISSEQNNQPSLDLNPKFVPGTSFTPPAYLPQSFPRPLYLPYDYIGHYSQSAGN